MKRKRRHRRNVKPFGTGHWNTIIDAVVHPLFEENKNAIWVDAALHAVAERNLPLSAKKFVKYSLPKLITESRKPTKKRKKT
jgi:hypothetical protein